MHCALCRMHSRNRECLGKQLQKYILHFTEWESEKRNENFTWRIGIFTCFTIISRLRTVNETHTKCPFIHCEQSYNSKVTEFVFVHLWNRFSTSSLLLISPRAAHRSRRVEQMLIARRKRWSGSFVLGKWVSVVDDGRFFHPYNSSFNSWVDLFAAFTRLRRDTQQLAVT